MALHARMPGKIYLKPSLATAFRSHAPRCYQVGYLPESTLWLHPSPQASAEDLWMFSCISPQGGKGFVEGITVANASRTELPPTPLTPFVKVRVVT